MKQARRERPVWADEDWEPEGCVGRERRIVTLLSGTTLTLPIKRRKVRGQGGGRWSPGRR